MCTPTGMLPALLLASLSSTACGGSVDGDDPEQGLEDDGTDLPGPDAGTSLPDPGSCEPKLSGDPNFEGTCPVAAPPSICVAPAASAPPSQVMTVVPAPACACDTCTTGVQVTARTPEGLDWSVTMSMPGLDDGSIQPGDEIEYINPPPVPGLFPGPADVEIIARRPGVGLVAYVASGTGPTDPLQICPFRPVCAGAVSAVGCAGERFDIAVTVDGETAAVNAGTAVQVGPLVVFNARYVGLLPTGSCDYGADRSIQVSAARPSR